MEIHVSAIGHIWESFCIVYFLVFDRDYYADGYHVVQRRQ